MRDSKLPLVLLIVLLVGGLGLGAWWLLGDDPAPDRPGATAQVEQDDPSDPSDDPTVGEAGTPATTETTPDTTTDETTAAKVKAADPETGATPDAEATAAETAESATDWVATTRDFTISGTVRYREDNRPAAGAAISARESSFKYMLDESDTQPAARNRPAPAFAGETTSDGNGEFTLRVKVTWHVPAAHDEQDQDPFDVTTFVVVARLNGYAAAESEPIWPGAQGEQKVELLLAVPAAVSGRVIDGATRAGIAGATVTFWDFEGAAGISRTAFTDDQGYFSVNDLPASNYMVQVRAEGYAQPEGWTGNRQADVRKGGETNLGDIPLSRSAGIVGSVVSAEGKPVASARVQLAQHRQGWGERSNGTTSGEDGRFRISSIQPGSYDLTVRSEEHGLATLKDVAVESGKTIDVGTIRLELGDPLTGRVVDAGGNGIAGARVRIDRQSADPGFIVGARGDPLGTATTDKNGGFAIAVVPEGDLVADVTADGFSALQHSFKFPCAPLTLKLLRGGTIFGRVVDIDGKPVANANAAVIAHGTQQYSWWKMMPGQAGWSMAMEGARSGEDGRFTLRNVAPGTYVVLCSVGGENGGFKDNIAVENESAFDAGDIQLGANGSVKITVTEHGRPVANLRVGLNRGFDMRMGDHSATTDSLGIAEIRDVPSGTWIVRTARDTGSFDTDLMTRRAVTIKPAQNVEFRLELREGDNVYLHGRMTVGGKATLKEVILIGKGEQSGVVKTARCSEGHYEFSNITPGRYNLYASPDSMSLGGMVSLDLTEPGEVEVTRDFAAFAVSGTVTTPENSALQNAAVNIALQRADTDDNFGHYMASRTTCDAAGAFRLEGICDGKFTLTAVLDGVGTARRTIQVSNANLEGLSLAIEENAGALRVRISKITGTAVSGNGFGMVQLKDADGALVVQTEQNGGWFMAQEAGGTTVSNLLPGTYTVEISASGFLPVTRSGVQVTKGARAEVEVELTAAAELQATCTNVEITQAMLDKAVVRYMDAQGRVVPVTKGLMDAWGAGAPAERPTLAAGYIGEAVTELRIKLAGYAELSVPVQFAPGKKIEMELTFIAE